MAPRRGTLILGAVAVVSVLATVAISVAHFSKSAASNVAPVIEKASVAITASPAEAKITFDDVLQASNPATMTIPRDNAHHRVRAEAPGYVTKTQLVLANSSSLTIEIALERVPAPPTTILPMTSPPSASLPATTTTVAPVRPNGRSTPPPSHSTTASASPPTTAQPPPHPTASATATSAIYTDDPWKR